MTNTLEGYTAARPLTGVEYAWLEVAVKYVGLTASTHFLLRFLESHSDERFKSRRTLFWDYHLETWTIR